MRRECRECFPRHQFQRKPLVSHSGMHHGTCVTHVPWCMSGPINPDGGENVPGISGARATRDFTYLVRGPCHDSLFQCAHLIVKTVDIVLPIFLLNWTHFRHRNVEKSKKWYYVAQIEVNEWKWNFAHATTAVLTDICKLWLGLYFLNLR